MSPTTMPHLIDFLWSGYERHLQVHLTKMKEAGTPVMYKGNEVTTGANAAILAPAAAFRVFCADWLRQNRVVENFPADMNHGVKFSDDNGVMNAVLICPPYDEDETQGPGTMQEANDIPITPTKKRG